eukprot:16433080-Heterocapsa_arctica.AAC.1
MATPPAATLAAYEAKIICPRRSLSSSIVSASLPCPSEIADHIKLPLPSILRYSVPGKGSKKGGTIPKSKGQWEIELAIVEGMGSNRHRPIPD